MYGSLQQELVGELDGLREARLYKGELVLESPQSAHVEVEGMGGLLNLCANNYLGLADHPAVIEAARDALERWGFGMASVRFICGTQTLHKQLEERLSAFLGTEDTILFSSCFDANGGLFEALLGPDDAVISDALNHASIIDGIRLCKAQRLRYANGDLDELEARLEEAAGAHTRMIATDGVFSMDGHIADLAGICDLAERHDALVMVDDSHAVGLRRAERPRHARAARGHRARRHRHRHARQGDGRRLGRLRLGPPRDRRAAAPARAAVPLLEQRRAADRRRRAEGDRARRGLARAARPALGEHRPVPRRDDRAPGSTSSRGRTRSCPSCSATPRSRPRFAERLWARGVYAVSFSFPVVPRGQARIRTQLSAAHTFEDVDFAVAQFVAVKDELAALTRERRDDPRPTTRAGVAR